MLSLWKNNLTALSETVNNKYLARQWTGKGNKNLTAKLNDTFRDNLSKVLNENIKLNTSPLTRGKLEGAMKRDLSRMEYSIDGHNVRVPGDTEGSIAKLNDVLNDNPARLPLAQNIDSIDAFLHQGIFVDIFESIPCWKDEKGNRLDIKMVSLDQLRNNVSFDIRHDGIIKMTAQSNVSNIILKNGDIIHTDKDNSKLDLEVTLLLKNRGGSCCAQVVNVHNIADKAILKLSGLGKM